MNLRLLSLVLALPLAAGIHAQERMDTATVPERVDSVSVEASGSGRKSGLNRLDFDIPFYSKVKRTDGRAVVGNMGIGAIFTEAGSPLDFKSQGSREFFFYTLDSRTKGHSTLSTGTGMTFRNLALREDAMYLKDGGAVGARPFPDGSSPRISKLRVVSVNFPVLYSLDFGGGFGATFGPVPNLNVSSSIVNKYDIDGKKHKDKFRRAGCNLVTVDAMFQLNLKVVSLYVKYSPLALMNKDGWPEFKTWTFGIAL